LSGDYELEEKVQKLFNAFSGELNQYPTGHTLLLQSYLLTQMGMKEVIVLSPNQESKKLLDELQIEFHPEITYLIGNDREKLAEIASFTNDYESFKDKTTVYICENFVCNKPTTVMEEAIRLLNNKDR
ncbi:MAG: hypothetical protein ACJ8MO_09095, partial [Bacillus sp. (in: firmicutes)]